MTQQSQHAHVQGPGGGGPEQNARVEQMKRTWQQKKRIGDHLKRIKNKIAVYSGKGGVGKSTVAVNLAVLLAKQGKAVGVLDADIDCPNLLKIFKSDSEPAMVDNQIIPATMHGVRVVSMGSFQRNEEKAIIFRGPMIHNSLTQFVEMTDWGDLDFLFIDMPPGTSDAALTVMQMMQLDGVIVVTTPQELAVLDATRCINMIKKLNVEILGVVENMVGDIFGEGGGLDLSKRSGVPFLGSIALRNSFREPSMPVSLVDADVRSEFEAFIDRLAVPVA